MSVVGSAFRRERVRVPVWALIAGVLAAATAAAIPQAFGDATERRTVIELITATPSLLAIRGIPDGTDEGAFAYAEIFTYLGLVAGLMSVFLVTRQTRQDEDTGRAELLLGTPVHRRGPLTAAVVVATAANVALGLLVTLGFASGGLPVPGSAGAGLAVTCVGLAYTGVAAVVAQVAPTSRATNGIGVGIVAGTFTARAAGDALGTRSADGLTVTSAWPSWLSPIGWGQHVFPFTRQDWSPLVPCLVVAAVGVAAALVLRGRRDLGASLLRERPGPADGRLRTSLGLAWRLHRTTVLAWAVGGAVLGAFAGGLGTTAIDAIGADVSVTTLLETLVPGGRGALLDEFVAAVVGITAVLAAAAGIGALDRAAEDDRDGRSALLLATPVGRVRRLAEWLGIGVAAAVAVALTAGVVGGLAFVATGTDRFWSTVAAGLAQLPAALVLVGFSAVVGVVLPRIAGWLVWVALGVALLLGQFGGLLRVPDWARQISPFTHTPGVPAAHVDWSGAWWLLGVAVALGVLALVLARRQETVS